MTETYLASIGGQFGTAAWQSPWNWATEKGIDTACDEYAKMVEQLWCDGKIADATAQLPAGRAQIALEKAQGLVREASLALQWAQSSERFWALVVERRAWTSDLREKVRREMEGR
jgi:hypothetical protein